MDNQWEQAVVKLIQQTEAGIIKWEENDGVIHCHPEFRFVGPAYSATIGEKTIAVFEYRFQSYDDSGAPETLNNIRIEFVTPAGEKLFAWPPTDSRYDLLDSIRQRSTGADEFITQFLASK